MKFFGKEIADSREIAKKDKDIIDLTANFNFLMEQLVSKQGGGYGDETQAWYENVFACPIDWVTKRAQDERLKASQSESSGTVRPPIDTPFVSTDSGAKIPVNPFPLHFLYQLARTVDALRIPIEVINRELFRNGIKIEPRFRLRCKNCEKEFSNIPNKKITIQHNENTAGTEDDLSCDACGKSGFDKPEPKQRKKLDQLLRKAVNDNGQRLKDVLKMIEKDLEIADWGAFALLKDYRFDANGKIKDSKLREIIRLHPPQCFMIVDYDGRLGYDDRGRKVFVCPRPDHRNTRINSSDALGDRGKIPKCPKCGLVGLPAWLESNSQYATNVPNPKRVLYTKGEVYFKAGKYWPDLVYGFSPIYSIWSKVMALAHMDEYVRKYFDKFRPPKGLLVIASRNTASVQKMFDKIKLEGKRDPYNIHPLIVENERGGRNMVQYVNLMGSLEDLKFIEIRDEFRRTIGAMYGVLPLFSGDFPSGWNQEGLEMAVTNRAVQDGQQFMQESFLDPLADALGVTDWTFKLERSEETDELREHQIRGMEITNAEGMKRMGFLVEMDGDGNFLFSQKPVEMSEDATTGTTKKPLSSRSTQPKGEEMTTFGGQKLQGRPSDEGGMVGGHPASGAHTSRSQKKKYKVIRAADGNIEVEEKHD